MAATPTLLFDLDGTLVDSAPDVCGAVNHVFAEAGLPAIAVDRIKGYLGHGARVLIERAVADMDENRDTETLDRLTHAFLAYYADHPVVSSTVFPGVFDALETLRGEGATMAICTNKPSVTTAPVLEALDLDGRFDAVVCGDQVVNRKPHGDHIRETVAACGGAMETAIMIGDSENDILSAIDAGVPSIAVRFGYALGPVDGLGADIVIDSFDELADALFTIGARKD